MAGEDIPGATQLFNASRRLSRTISFGGDTSGTSTGTDATTMTDALASWTVDAYAGKTVYIDGKTGVVVSNTDTVITVASWTGGTPTAVSPYMIGTAGETFGYIGDQEIFTVTGLVVVRMVTNYCTEDLAGAGATLKYQFGASVFLDTTTATAIDTGKFWISANTAVDLTPLLPASVGDIVTASAKLVVATAQITDGVIDSYLYWDPVSDDASVAAA